MKIKRNKLYVSVVNEQAKNELFSEEIKYNLELSLFALPEILDGDWQVYLDRLIKMFEKLPLRLALHGPFMDLSYHSKDTKIRGITKSRFIHTLDIAERLSADYLVFHSTYSQFVVHPRYGEIWKESSLKFWPEIVRMAEKKNLLLVLENVWDDGPEHIKELIKEIGSANFKACLDVGHMNIFSKTTPQTWLRVLGTDLACLHLHNNFGKFDDHFELDRGNINYQDFFTWLEQEKLNPFYSIEVEKKEYVEKSIRYLQNSNFL